MGHGRETDIYDAEVAEVATRCGGNGFATGVVAAVPSWMLLRRALSLAVHHSWHDHDLVKRCLLAMARESIRMREHVPSSKVERVASPPVGAMRFANIDGRAANDFKGHAKHRAEWNAAVRCSLVAAWNVVQSARALTRRPGPLGLALEEDGGGETSELRLVPLDTLPLSTSAVMEEASMLAIERARGNFAAEEDSASDGVATRPSPLAMSLAGSRAECLLQESTVHSILLREEAAIAAAVTANADGGAAATDEAPAMVSMDRVLRHYLTLRKETCSGFQGLWSASVDAWDDEVRCIVQRSPDGFSSALFSYRSLRTLTPISLSLSLFLFYSAPLPSAGLRAVAGDGGAVRAPRMARCELRALPALVLH